MWPSDHYRPPAKLVEGNVFSSVCQSTGGRSHVTITDGAFAVTLQAQPESPPPASPTWNCSAWTLLYRPPPLQTFKLVHYEERMVQVSWHLTGMLSCCSNVFFI